MDRKGKLEPQTGKPLSIRLVRNGVYRQRKNQTVGNLFSLKETRSEDRMD
jgi:hypothetical protein